MENREKYNKVFKEIFGISEDKLKELKYHEIEEWDSVGHMNLIIAIEDIFNIMMNTDEIIEFNSYENGKRILEDNYGIKIL